MPFKSFSTITGTCGGTILATAPYIGSEDIIKTVLLACIGAFVSFSVSLSLKILIKRVFSQKVKSPFKRRNFKKKI